MSKTTDRLSVKPSFTSATPSVANTHGKVVPQAVDLEEAVLGAMMLEQTAVNAVIDVLGSESFYKPSHKKIYETIQQLFNDSEPIDLLTVTEALRKEGNLEFVGGAYAVANLTTRVASTANVEFHARIISQKHIQRSSSGFQAISLKRLLTRRRMCLTYSMKLNQVFLKLLRAILERASRQ